jgi:hypothetical protein
MSAERHAHFSAGISFVTCVWPSTQHGCGTVCPAFSGERFAHYDTCVFSKENGCGAQGFHQFSPKIGENVSKIGKIFSRDICTACTYLGPSTLN